MNESDADRTDKFVNSYVLKWYKLDYFLKMKNQITWFFFNRSDIVCEFRLNATRLIDPELSVKSRHDISPRPCELMKFRFGYTDVTDARIFQLKFKQFVKIIKYKKLF